MKKGAAEVYAVDVGYGQIDPSLRNDPRVHLFEKTHILKWDPVLQSAAPGLVTIDVSFISLKRILPKFVDLFSPLTANRAPRTEILALIKPQFEAEARELKKGIVKDEGVRGKVVQEMVRFAESQSFSVKGHFPCPVFGAKGNREEWLYLGTLGSGLDL